MSSPAAPRCLLPARLHSFLLSFICLSSHLLFTLARITLISVDHAGPAASLSSSLCRRSSFFGPDGAGSFCRLTRSFFVCL